MAASTRLRRWLARWDYRSVYRSIDHPGMITVCLELDNQPHRSVALLLTPEQASRLAGRLRHQVEQIESEER
jgi:hypothetical protein